jgi:hypothetical protein
MKIPAIILSAAIAIRPLPVMSSESRGPLTSGGAAGVKQAQGERTESTLIVIGAGALVALGVLLALNNKGEALNCFAVSGGNAPACPGLPVPPPTTAITTTTAP